MQNAIGKICLILAGSDLTPSEIKRFCRWLDANGAHQLEAAVLDLQNHADDLAKARSPGREFWDRPIRLRTRDHSTPPEDEPAEKIKQLLLVETRLSGNAASELLYLALRNKYALPLKKSKDSFGRWIRAISKVVPYSILLHEATKIRNREVHSPTQDWPLRNKK